MRPGLRGETSDDRTPAALLLPTYGFALIVGCWTLAYHLMVWADWPAGWIWLPFVLFVATTLWATRSEIRLDLASRDERGPFWGTLVFGSGVGIASMFVAYYNPDDVNYLHRALLQLRHLDQPFELGQSYFTGGVLPPLTAAHSLTSHELLVSMLADLFGVDPVWAFQKAGSFVGHLLFAFVFTALYRELGLSPWRALLAAVLAFCFCLVDLRIPGRSYGNVIIALYNGKVLLWGVGLPLLLLLSLRYLARPSATGLLWLGLAAVGMIGLSGSAVFLVPALLGIVGVAYFLSARPNRNRLARAAGLQLASVYALSIGLAGVIGLLARPSDLSLFDGFPNHWFANLRLVTDQPIVALRDVALLLFAPLLALSTEHRRFLPLLSLVWVSAFANPLTGPILLDLLTPGAYWRMAYLLPVTLCAGLVAEAGLRVFETRRSWMLFALVFPIVVLCAFIQARDWPFTLANRADRNRVGTTLPFGPLTALRMPPSHLRFAKGTLESLRGRSVLASDAIFPTLALLEPTLRFETGRWARHSFANGGKSAEGIQRQISGFVVTYCQTGPPLRAAFLESVGRGVDALVVGPCFRTPVGRAAILELLASSGKNWSQRSQIAGFSLLLRGPESASQ